MSSQKTYEEVFLEVARDIHSLVFGDNRDEILLQRIRNALRDFAVQEKKHCDYMKGQSVVSSDMLIPDKYKSPMRAMFSKHKYVKDGYGQKCIGAHLPNLDDNPKERQRRNYVSLAIIHDNMLPEAERINNDILPSELAGHIWELFSPYQVFDNDYRPWYGDKKSFLEVAMMSIQREVANKSAEKGRDAKGTLVAIAISLILIFLFELLVYIVPITWISNHPHRYGIQGSIICLIPCLILGFFKPVWRKWFWGGAFIAFLAVLLSLL